MRSVYLGRFAPRFGFGSSVATVGLAVPSVVSVRGCGPLSAPLAVPLSAGFRPVTAAVVVASRGRSRPDSAAICGARDPILFAERKDFSIFVY